MKSIKLAAALALGLAALGTSASAETWTGPDYGTPSPFPGYHPSVDADLRNSYKPPFKYVGPNTAKQSIRYKGYHNNYTDYRPYVRGTYGSLACADASKGLRYQKVWTFWRGHREVLRCLPN